MRSVRNARRAAYTFPLSYGCWPLADRVAAVQPVVEQQSREHKIRRALCRMLRVLRLGQTVGSHSEGGIEAPDD